MRIFLFLGLCAALLAAGCKKDTVDPNGLVPATQEGKNTGDFLLNGQPFGPMPRLSSPGSKPVGAFWDHFSIVRSIQISFLRQERDVNRTERLFAISIANIKRPGVYNLTDAVVPNVVNGSRSFAIYEVPGVFPVLYRDYITGPLSPGQVTVTRFDTVAHIVSGTFEAKLREYQGPDSLAITQGRFDCTF